MVMDIPNPVWNDEEWGLIRCSRYSLWLSPLEIVLTVPIFASLVN
ncbi:hypothetical protein GP5015_937 [gamma proteobacterium HTCC5015]|nr:hypothetical protein GP5015_937 [gamma proteobacterium HTCC5015]